MWTEFSWLRIGTTGELLWRRQWIIRFHKIRGISWLAQKLTAFQEVPRSTELVNVSCYTCTVELQYQCLMRAKKVKEKRPWLSLRYYRSIYLEGPRKTSINVRVVGLPDGFWTRNLENIIHWTVNFRTIVINFPWDLSGFSQWRKYRPYDYIKWKESSLLRHILIRIHISGTLLAFYISHTEWLLVKLHVLSG